MDLLESIETRRSIRAFKSTPVPKETISRILEVAARSPSYTNTQPWEVAVVSGKKKDELSKIIYHNADTNAPVKPDMPFPKEWPPAQSERSKDHNIRRFAAFGIERNDEKARKNFRMMNFTFYGAPTVIFIYIDKTMSSWSIFDMGLFTENLCLAAHSMGVGTCIQGSAVESSEAIREFLGIPNTKMMLMGIAIGYPDVASKFNSYHSLRAKPSEFTKWFD